MIALFAAGIVLALQRYAGRNRVVVSGLPALLLSTLLTLTWRQAATYCDAQTLYEVTLQRNPESWMAHNNLGIILSQQGDLAGAMTHYDEAIAIEPHNSESYTNLGNAYMMQGRVAEALPQFEKTLSLAPRAVQAKNNLAWLLATARDPALRDAPRALQLARDAVEISESKDPVILRTLATAYAQNGRFAEANTAAEKALALAGDNAAFSNKVREEAKLYRARMSATH